MHLSTNDQHIFYKRIGYIESTPVNAVRKCTAIHQTVDDEVSWFYSQSMQFIVYLYRMILHVIK